MTQQAQIVVTEGFPMKVGDVLRIRGAGELLEYFVEKQGPRETEWQAKLRRRALKAQGNKEGVMERGNLGKIQKLRGNPIPTGAEMYKRMERD